ncbi:MAG: radical SAM protein [Planctomycetota bacterium]
MPRRNRAEPMPVKHWSAAGILLSYWCNARCASCYANCGPDRTCWIDPDLALAAWDGLIAASPHGCRVHLTGGEPFGNWPLLIDIARRAHAAGLCPLEKVETNASWASDDALVRRRIEALDAAGMRKLSISVDPYHQQFVPIALPRRAARLAEQVLGPRRVQVRWRDWLRDGFDTADLAPDERGRVFAAYARRRRDRLNGRAAEMLSDYLPGKSPEDLADETCREPLLRSRHVHVDPAGWVSPGVCAGIVVGRIGPETPGQIWRRLDEDHRRRPVVATLARGGPVALLDEARCAGFRPSDRYASKCGLCWDVRAFWARRGGYVGHVGPAGLYRAAGAEAAASAPGRD